MKLAVTAALLTISALFATSAHAQAGLGGSFSLAHIGPDAKQPWIYGPTFSFEDEHGRGGVKSGIDIRFSYLRDHGLGTNSLLFGPRVAFPQRHPRIEPYIEFLFGYLGVENRVGHPLDDHFDVQFIGGLDHRIARHLDWRIFEYSFGIPVDDSDYNLRHQFSTGLMARF